MFIAAATPVSGKLADRFGTVRVMQAALVLYGAGLLVPCVFDDKLVVVAVAPIVGFGGGVVMTLPYAILIPLMEDDDHGLTTGLYSVKPRARHGARAAAGRRGHRAARRRLRRTDGYQAMWGVSAVAILLSVPVVGVLRDRA